MTEQSPMVAVQAGPFTLFPESRILRGPLGEGTICGQPYLIVERLMRTPGKVVSIDSLIIAVWGCADREPVDARKIVRLLVHRVRHMLRALDDTVNDKHIRNVWGVGYMWSKPGTAAATIAHALASPGEGTLSGAHPSP